MKYKVIGIIKHEEIVDTDSVGFKHYLKSPFSEFNELPDNILYDIRMRATVQGYVEKMLSYQIIDDNGYGTITPNSFDWTVEELYETTTKT